MAKNGAGYDPDIEDVPNAFEEDIISDNEDTMETPKIVESALVKVGDEWFVDVKYDIRDGVRMPLVEYNKLVVTPIVPPNE